MDHLISKAARRYFPLIVLALWGLPFLTAVAAEGENRSAARAVPDIQGAKDSAKAAAEVQVQILETTRKTAESAVEQTRKIAEAAIQAANISNQTLQVVFGWSVIVLGATVSLAI